jgi:hypothetical protein
MDDYYGLIAKAVKSLDLSTETTRRAIYDLARSAMLAKLRSLTPALSESDIRREQVALDEAAKLRRRLLSYRLAGPSPSPGQFDRTLINANWRQAKRPTWMLQRSNCRRANGQSLPR